MSSYLGTLSVQNRYRGELQADYLFIGEDNAVNIDRLKENVFGGTFLDGATAEMTLLDTSGTTVAGITFPVSLTAITTAPGRYEGVLEAEELTLSKGEEYDLRVTVESGGSIVARWLRRLIVIDRV